MKRKKIYLIFHGRFPSEKAASLFAVKDAESFADEGCEVVVLVPRRLRRVKTDPYAFYGVRKNFKIVRLPVIDFFHLPLRSLAFWISFVSFSLSLGIYLLCKGKKEDIYYSNEWLPLLVLSYRFSNTFYELHDFPESKQDVFKKFIKKMKWVLIHNKWKLYEARSLFKLEERQVMYVPNAVDVETFSPSLDTKEARAKLSLPADKKIVIYTGHLYGWKGVDTLARAGSYLDDTYLIIFIGGTAEDLATFRKKYGEIKNILIVGHKPHTEIPLWQSAGDVLALPNTATEKISKFYTSPMKLFEYMASGRPIVASDIPSITEILNESNALLVEPDNPQALAQGIRKLAGDSALASRLAKRASSDVLEYTWQKRACAIISFMEKGGSAVSVSHKARIMLLIRYLFSGFLAFGSNIVLLYIFKNYFDMWYLTASTLAFIISVVISFLAQKFITFQDTSTDRIPHQATSYIVIAVFNVIANGVLVFCFVDIASISYMIAQILSAGIIAGWSFLVYHFVIFSHGKLR